MLHPSSLLCQTAALLQVCLPCWCGETLREVCQLFGQNYLNSTWCIFCALHDRRFLWYKLGGVSLNCHHGDGVTWGNDVILPCITNGCLQMCALWVFYVNVLFMGRWNRIHSHMKSSNFPTKSLKLNAFILLVHPMPVFFLFCNEFQHHAPPKNVAVPASKNTSSSY